MPGRRCERPTILFAWKTTAVFGILLTVFLGVISVQGASSAVTDGVTVKTAKFITGNFVPVIGRVFTDATDTVISASMLLKNTVGIAGVEKKKPAAGTWYIN